ncbi:TMEM175 family protein [Streptomyces sp. V4-01]|uniref:TMEM175 family protein n=1 Tax=Actinacidiphila polyblastidii TaxID=3110430 RepID=A0ABU7P3L9_9ACTN|nr:TMEM175 family protein [Streptomyces sp. V4-01]
MSQRPISQTAAADGDPSRLLALADGVFAIAITLLVLNIGVRDGLDDAAFHQALRDAVPELLAYGLSFAVIAALWRDHRRLFGRVTEVDEPLTRLALLGMGLVALLPFPTTLLAEYGRRPQSVAIYAGAVALVDAVHLAMLRYVASRRRLVSTPLPAADVRLLTVDLGSTIVVFLASVPLAYASASAAKWCWLVLVPVKVGVGRLRARVERG